MVILGCVVYLANAAPQGPSAAAEQPEPVIFGRHIRIFPSPYIQKHIHSFDIFADYVNPWKI